MHVQDTGISSKAMSIMNSFINDIFEKIGAETAVCFQSSFTAWCLHPPDMSLRSLQQLGMPGLALHTTCENDLFA